MPGLRTGSEPHSAALVIGNDSGKLLELIVATDVYTWKLLRRDLGNSPDEVRALVAGLIDNITRDEQHDKRSHPPHLANAAAEPAAQLRINGSLGWRGNLPPQRALARELKRRGHESTC